MAETLSSSEKMKSLEEIRRSVTYHPSVWGDYFLAYTDDVTEITDAEKEKLENLKEMVKNLLAQTPDDSTAKIELIDAIQRLGIAYHFEEEIEESLQKIHDTCETQSSKDGDDVRVLALRFRLLRQEGFRVPSDVFNKLVDEEGKFKEALISNDVEGLLSLYEASNYGTEGEEILQRALELSSSRLETMKAASKRVREALEIPISRSLVRVGARKFISLYEEDEAHNETLLSFAKLDFNMVQKGHQRELHHVTKWWKGLDFANKLPFARDRMVEGYFWALGVYFEPHYTTARIFLAKVSCLISTLDDIYDVYGTLDQLRLFTEAIRRWNVDAADPLPPYMRTCYEALLDVYGEMEDQVAKTTGQTHRIQRAKEEMKNVTKAYMEETEWCFGEHIPRMEEYMEVALVSSALTMLTVAASVGMKDAISNHDFDWITSDPPLVRGGAIIFRLMDDIVGYGMEARAELKKQVEKAWKDINEGLLEPRPASMAIMVRAVNLSRFMPLVYTGEDAYTNSKSKTKQIISDVLVNPFTI